MDTTANTAPELGRTRKPTALLVAAGLLFAAPASAGCFVGARLRDVVLPWISPPQSRLRMKQMQARLDAGISASGFSFSLAAGCGF